MSPSSRRSTPRSTAPGVRLPPPPSSSAGASTKAVKTRNTNTAAKTGRVAGARKPAPGSSPTLKRSSTRKAEATPTSPKAKRKTVATRPPNRPRTKAVPPSDEVAEARRRRRPLIIGAAASVLILVTSFPAMALYGQHQQLASATGQYSTLVQQNRSWQHLLEPSAIRSQQEQTARSTDHLVLPGQTLYQTPVGGGAGATDGDPANEPLKAPGPGMESTVPSRPAPGAAGASAHPAGWLGRIASSLEFWK